MTNLYNVVTKHHGSLYVVADDVGKAFTVVESALENNQGTKEIILDSIHLIASSGIQNYTGTKRLVIDWETN